jgi:hypothetical protein
MVAPGSGTNLRLQYEVLDSIDEHDWPGLCEELGDLLLQPGFCAQIAFAEELRATAPAVKEQKKGHPQGWPKVPQSEKKLQLLMAQHFGVDQRPRSQRPIEYQCRIGLRHPIGAHIADER